MEQDERFDHFYALDYRRLVGALALVMGNVAEAQDAVDEALARAWDQVRRGREVVSLPGWVRVTAMNLARGGLRRRAVERRAHDRLARLELARSPEDTALVAIEVREALAVLSRRQREVAVLHYLFDLPVAQVAAELRVGEGTVKSMLSRARAALAAVMTNENTEADHDAPA